LPFVSLWLLIVVSSAVRYSGNVPALGVNRHHPSRVIRGGDGGVKQVRRCLRSGRGLHHAGLAPLLAGRAPAIDQDGQPQAKQRVDEEMHDQVEREERRGNLYTAEWILQKVDCLVGDDTASPT